MDDLSVDLVRNLTVCTWTFLMIGDFQPCENGNNRSITIEKTCFELTSFDKMPGKYDEYDWDELPEDIQKAAILLGFDKEIWDTDDEPSDCDEYWKDLTPAQQEAATKLGYNEEMWNKE